MPPARSTPQRYGVLTDHRTPPGSPAVTTEKIYRALMNLTREMQEGRRKQAEERQSMEAKSSDLTEEVFHLRQRVEETTRDDEVAPPTGKRRKKAKSPQLSKIPVCQCQFHFSSGVYIKQYEASH
uniref:Uncharacterized protein n=1 Tax=Branchiostoma floridae TaxID=7739 RepID=C3ZZ38_BRAFL|eukprot:XP_002586191.1 hypothetical protein BRAFLDRAFT_109695 [Branchiostoma floridae]